ncbi:AMP-binding protein [Marinibactrum halimedae]|uniref:Carrier domain-containing protein n=1 Tax=Marinibactrum halimedae TaxID=1444977 RepID=A0AA37T9J2_9GAMM|nr:AMP-binding protein [Marinibactrum halimedae]MCD9460149.1 AMP-binding protein [Marinibactrum halimedae]GLS26381.1 hypothetical protein GCM10007877_20960 [Marinibactrum halimedae]
MNKPHERKSAAKVKLLALHGSGSNSHVTQLQLENLTINETEFDITYLNGPISTDQPGPGIKELDGIFTGPWFSWFPTNIDYSAIDADTLLTIISDALDEILNIVETEGPFDGIFGFSQGGIIASLLINLHHDNALQAALEKHRQRPLTSSLKNQPLFNTAIIACAAAPLSFSQLRSQANLGSAPTMTNEIRIIHLIGRQDSFKPWSESLALSLNAASNTIFYLSEGHEIPRSQRQNSELNTTIRQYLLPQNNVFQFVSQTATQETRNTTPAKTETRNAEIQNMATLESPSIKWKKTSPLSSRTVASDVQMVEVAMHTENHATTILDALAHQPQEAPLFRIAREKNENLFTSYGDMLNFCQPLGEGDLRRLGVKTGEVVAYVAPPGGNAIAATAFLSIAAQTCAVPFSTNMSADDTLLALEQYDVKHMILFDGVNAREVRTAFRQYEEEGKAQLHHASARGNSLPGLFIYHNAIEGFQTLPKLSHPSSANALLLRTSGTTSIPKVVPLRQQDLLLNAAVLADGIGITHEDITYSVMPLDHIGGISASILCSITVGASITCESLYTPQGMVEALEHSNPKPTWYSAVPTIHNATTRFLQENADTYLNDNGVWESHHIRMIRSGAAALKESDRIRVENTFGCEVITTYSMSELMPICQPPQEGNHWRQSPGAVGVPVSASLAIVDPQTLQPLPYGIEGEIAISGSTVFEGYLNNSQANNQSRFIRPSLLNHSIEQWFLTGDLGEIDSEGTLTLKGRIKELIKRGGEQIAPAEVESFIIQHPAVKTAVCFSVPSDLYGEEVGCALVLESTTSSKITQAELVQDLRQLLREKKLASFKIPSVWRLVDNNDLPRTASKKIIRNGLAEKLGIEAQSTETQPTETQPTGKPDIKAVSQNNEKSSTTQATTYSDKPKVDWAALAGFRFILACYVMFMHIGSNESWSAFSNLRQFPWHVHTFFAVAGFSLAIIMPSFINKKMSFVSARVLGMYPLYALAVIFALGNVFVSCQPSTFSSIFNWSPLLAGSDQMFCQGTPLVQDSWLANVLLSLGIHLTGLQATPLWGASWFLGFYLWFISMYFQCLIVFPWVYNTLYKNRGNFKKIFSLTLLTLGVNLFILLSFWYGYAVDATSYGLFDPLTGQRTIPTPSQVDIAGTDNAVILGFYLFAPFWMVYFIAGICAAFLFDALRPSEQKNAKIWGYIADTITVTMILLSIAQVAQGYFPYGPNVTEVALDGFFMRPEEANSFADPSTVNRIWDNIYGRLFAPITLLWIFAITTGQGITARLLRFNPLSQTLAPTAYACFLFHQMVGQWYYAATRGEWWNWWTHQKTFYWFSPQPVPVEWYEYFYVVGIVVIFAKIVQPLEPMLRRSFSLLTEHLKWFKSGNSIVTEEQDTTAIVVNIIEKTTGMEVKPEWSLEECGLASLGIVQFASTLESEFAIPTDKIRISAAELIEATNIYEIATIIDKAILESQTPSPVYNTEQERQLA